MTPTKHVLEEIVVGLQDFLVEHRVVLLELRLRRSLPLRNTAKELIKD